jgi:YfiH family protein
MVQPLLADDLAGLTGIAHGFFTRKGGVSQGIYANLNCGSGSRDEAASVRENRARVAAYLGTGAANLVSAHQVHGTTALIATEPWPTDRRPKADALVTATPGLALGVLTADCAPVLLAEPQARVVAAVHAGWRGALAGAVEAAIEAMQELGAERRHIRAAVGPCIGLKAYEVGPEFEAEFLKQDSDNVRFFARTGSGARPHFDLSNYVVHRLRRAGVGAAGAVAACCYGREEDFFSYRRARLRAEPDYGRQISAIVLA